MFSFNHFNFNVLDLERSLKFYDEAFGLKPVREKEAADGSFKLVFLGDGVTDFQLELTYLTERTESYGLIISVSVNFILPSRPTIMTLPTRSTPSLAASAMKTPPWASTSSQTPTAIG